MSYRERRTRKQRRAQTGLQLKRLIVRDTRFCMRHEIPEFMAHRWDRSPDHTIRPL
jgi:hypothetical protein